MSFVTAHDAGSIRMSAPLDGLFARLNRRFFAGQLPRYRVRRLPLRAFDGQCDAARRIIWIARGLRGHDLRATLLHEMCHIACGPGHGRRFWSELRRLDRLGEPLPLIDQEIAREDERRWTRRLRRGVDVAGSLGPEWDAHARAVHGDLDAMRLAGEDADST